MCKGLICLAIIATSVLLFAVAKQVQQTKKQRVIPDQFQIEVGDIPRWLYRHAYNVSINGRLKTDRCRVPLELTFNRSMLPADLYKEVYLHKFIMPPVPKERPDPIDPRNLTFDEMRKVEEDEFFGTERAFAWVKRGWNWTCEVCQKEFPVESDYNLHVAWHYVTNYSATPIMNWTILKMQDEKFRNESESYWIDYWWKVSRGEIDPVYDTDIVPTTSKYLSDPIICYVCNASIYNTSDYNPHIRRHQDWEEEKIANLTAKHSRPTKSFDDIHFRKVYVPDSLNTLEEEEYEEAQRILADASHSLNTDEIMERTQNLSINKRLLEFGIDSRGYTITWPRVKLMPDMEPFNDSQSIGKLEPEFPDPELCRFQNERRKKWEEDYLRRRKAQEKGNPDFATYSLESNETALERRALNITRRRRKYTPKLIYIRRKKRDVATHAISRKKPKSTTEYPYKLLGKKILRRVNSNKRKTKDQVYKQQLAKIILKAKKYMLKFNKTNYPTTQSMYEKVQIYKIKEKFKKLNWFLHGLDNYTVPPEIDIDMITNTPYSTLRPLFYKRLEKRDLRISQYIDYKRHKRHIDELKGLIDGVDKIHQEMIADDGDRQGGRQRKKRFVNLEDINLQEIENVLNPLPPGTVGENPLKINQDVDQKLTFETQRVNHKKLLFKRDVGERANLLNDHIFENNLNAHNHFGRLQIEDLKDTKLKLLKKRDLSEKASSTGQQKTATESVEFYKSSEDEQGNKRDKRDIGPTSVDPNENIQDEVNVIAHSFNLLVKANKHYRTKRQVDEKKLQECEFFKNLLDENKALDEEERQVIRMTKDAIKRSAEHEAKIKASADAVKKPKESPEAGDNLDVQHFNLDQNHINRFNQIRNKRSPHNHNHEHHEEICELARLNREKRDPRFRKDRLSTKKKKRTTCPYFARTKYFYNCTACNHVFSFEGLLAQHEWKKHNGSAIFVSYDTKDIEDEYYSWDYEAIPRNDTIETTREKWEKKCLVPNQKRHRYMNKGCTARHREDGGGLDGGGDHNVKKRDVAAAPKRSAHKGSIRGVQKHKVVKRDVASDRIGNVHNMLKRHVRIEDSEGNPVTKFAPDVEAVLKGKYDNMFKGKSMELRRTEEISEMSGNMNHTPHYINDTLMEHIETLDTNETLAAALEARNRLSRERRDVKFEDLTDELHSNVRDHDAKYQWELDKSWEWRIKNVNIRDYMYRIMEKRMSPTTPPPDAVVYDMFDVSNEAAKYPSHESRNRRVSQFYADNGYFSGRTGSDLEIYMDENPHLPEAKEIGPPHHDYGKDYVYKPKPALFENMHKRYTNVKPGSRTTIPKGHTTRPNPEVDFTDKKDYYDSDIEVAKSQFRFRRDLNENSGKGQYSMLKSEDSVAKTVHRRRRGITYDSDYSSNLQQFSIEDEKPELFSKLYPNIAEYTPYTFYPTTLPWMTTDPNVDPAATHKWVEKDGPDSADSDHKPTLDALQQSVQDFLASELMSGELAKETIHPQDYQDWLEWQRNRSLEDDNSYHARVWTCKFHPCTFNASIEADVGDHIFVHHFTYPTNYKETLEYRVETSTLGWERLTNVDFLLHRYSDEAMHPEVREDFDIFTGLFDAASFPTVHPNYTDPSKPKRTRYVPPTNPMCETVASTKRKPHLKAHSLDHAKLTHTPGPHGKHHPTTPPHHKGHVREKRALDSHLPPMPPDSNERSGSRESRSGRRRRRYKRAYHSQGPISEPNSEDDLTGYDGPAFLKTGESNGEITPKEEGTTVWDWSSWQSQYEPQNQTLFTFSEETVPPKYRCKFCGDLFHEEDHLLQHKSSAHPRKKKRTTTPCIRMMKKYFTLDSEVDLSKNYDFVFSEPDNDSFVQHRPILEDSFYQSFDSKHPDHNVNSASYREIDEYVDWVFNKSKYSICNACGKNISDFSAEAHFRKHVSNIKKDYFDELPPEYMDRCFKEAHWNESWETAHHKLKRQYEENRIVQSMFEPETYKCNRCNATFRNHELTYAHLLEHKKNASRQSAREAAERTLLKREKFKHETSTSKDEKNWNPEYVDYLKKAGKRDKRAIDCIEIEYPEQPNMNHTAPLYKIYESFNSSKERIENITPPESLSTVLTVNMDVRELHQDNDTVANVKDDYNERSISENFESRVQDRYCQQNIDSHDKVTRENDIPVKGDVKSATEDHTVVDIPDYYLNVNYKADDDSQQDSNSGDNEDSSYESDSNADLTNGKKQCSNNQNSRGKRPTLEEFIAKMKQAYSVLNAKDILSTNSTLLRRIEKIFGKTSDQKKAFLRRLKREIDESTDSGANIEDRWNSTECNIVEKLEKKFNTSIKDRGHKLMETDVSRLIEDFGVGTHPNLTSEENRKRLLSFRECMKIIDLHETRSEQDYHVYNDHHLDYMRLRTESPTLSPSDESLIRSKPREEYSDYEELKSDRWKCFECNETFENYTAFLMHMKKPKEPKWPFLIDLENQKEQASMENLFTTKSYWVNECYECGKKFNSRKELLAHINDKGYESLPHVDKVTQSVKCVHCDLVYTNVQKYLEHRADVKEAEQMLKNLTEKEFCGDCKKYFDTHEDYLHHLNLERQLDYEEMPKYRCKICNFTYLDSITLALHTQKIHPDYDKEHKRKRRSCRIENRQKVKIFPRHEKYEVMRHIILKSVNEKRRKKRSADHKRKVRKAKMKSRRKRDLEELLRMKKRNHNHRNSGHKCACHDNGANRKKREINTVNKNNLQKNIINKRNRRGVDELMDKMDKEHEKYQMFNWNPNFNLKHPILMHDQYRHHYLQGLAEEEKYFQLEQRGNEQRFLNSRQAGQELVPPGQELEEDVNTYAFGPALFGTTWSYNMWPTIRYNILAPGKSYNNTQYFNRYYQNQTVKNRIKAIFRDYFAKPLNASVPCQLFVESERDTEEFESLAMKERRKRSVENSLDESKGLEKKIDNIQVMDGIQIINKRGLREKRHYIDKACFHERRERPRIGKKIDAKCNCKNKQNNAESQDQHTDIHKENHQVNIDNINNCHNDKVEVYIGTVDDNADNIFDGVDMKKIRQRTPKSTSPKPARTKYWKQDDDNDGAENVLQDVAVGLAGQLGQPLTPQCECHRRVAAHRNRRQIRVDVMNNNTIQKINWERLAKILVAENRNLSNLLDKHLTKRTTPIRKYECRHCGDIFPSLQPYVEHIVHHEKEFELEKSYPEEFNITCDHCYQIFSTEDAIHEHNLERMRILKEREAEDYAKLNRTTRRKIYTPFEDPFTIPIMENEDNTFWNPPPITVTDDPKEDRYYCYYCRDMMANTKEFVEHRKFHETSRVQAKAAYLERKKKLDEKIRREFSVEGEIHL